MSLPCYHHKNDKDISRQCPEVDSCDHLETWLFSNANDTEPSVNLAPALCLDGQTIKEAFNGAFFC